jgi:hypothetical protein
MMGEGMEACIEEGMDGEGMDGGGHGWGMAWICKYAVILCKKSSPITGSAQLAHHGACLRQPWPWPFTFTFFLHQRLFS